MPSFHERRVKLEADVARVVAARRLVSDANGRLCDDAASYVAAARRGFFLRSFLHAASERG